MSSNAALGGDPRITVARPDLASASLCGRVHADRFIEGELRRIQVEIVDLKRQPRRDAALDTQLLFGERVRVFEDVEGWAWLQAERDGYVGYATADAVGPVGSPATHRVAVNRTFVYPAPDMKQPVRAALPLDAHVAVTDAAGSFLRIGEAAFVYAAHLEGLDQPVPDFVGVAEQLLGAPYLWGGKSGSGIDCSGLVQLSLAVAGRPVPRDADLQEGCAAFEPVAPDARQRGDLVFWKGHVAIMSDPDALVHASGHHMLVVREPFRVASERIRDTNGQQVSSIRRIAR